MGAEQLSFIPELDEIDEKAVQRVIINELRNYRALKVKMDNKREQEEHSVALFPSLRAANGLDEFTKREELRVTQMERALNISLDETERTILERKYLAAVETNDLDIYLEFGIKKGKYYEKKRSAIFRLATSLGII